MHPLASGAQKKRIRQDEELSRDAVNESESSYSDRQSSLPVVDAGPSSSMLSMPGSLSPGRARPTTTISAAGIAALTAAAIAIDETPAAALGSRQRYRRSRDIGLDADVPFKSHLSSSSYPSLRRPGPPKLPCGEALTEALARHPHLTLTEHNRSPTLDAHKLDLVIFRIPSAPAVPGALLDPAMVTAPFSMARSVPDHLEPVIGTRDVYNYLRGDLTYLRESGGSPTAVRVPLALPGLPGGVADRPMLFIPDSVAGAAYGQEGSISVGGGGWVISERRWEGRLHGGARHWRRE
jgi:hypothetical protein